MVTVRGARPMSILGRAERTAKWLGALVTLAAASTVLPGVIRAVRDHGPARGRPQLVFTPVRILLVGAAWFGAAAAAWRPLRVRPTRIARWFLVGGGLAAFCPGWAWRSRAGSPWEAAIDHPRPSAQRWPRITGW